MTSRPASRSHDRYSTSGLPERKRASGLENPVRQQMVILGEPAGGKVRGQACKGGRVEEALKIIRDLGGVPVAITVIVDRSSEPPSFGTPFISLAALSFPTYQEEKLPAELACIPVTKPGS